MDTPLATRVAPPGVGDPGPDFTLPDHAGRSHRLSDFRGSPVVLAFNPDHWDPARAEHVETYNRLIERISGPGGPRLLSISGSGPWRELTFADDALAIPVLSGDTTAIARRYGVARGSAVFVLDAEGIVRWRHLADDSLPHPDDVARALAAATERRPGADGERASGDDVGATDGSRPAWTRRDFVATVLGASFAIALTPLAARADGVARAGRAPAGAGATTVPVTLRVNGRELSLALEPRVTLLDALREYAGLTGSKKGCDHGQCGACTVHVEGRRVLACLTFAVMQQGKAITTIEGLAAGAGEGELHPMQRAFIEHDGFQCGYCTPGQIMSAVALLGEPVGPDDADVREAMSGNLCRCGAYPGICAAVQDVRQQRRAARGGSPS